MRIVREIRATVEERDALFEAARILQNYCDEYFDLKDDCEGCCFRELCEQSSGSIVYNIREFANNLELE